MCHSCASQCLDDAQIGEGKARWGRVAMATTLYATTPSVSIPTPIPVIVLSGAQNDEILNGSRLREHRGCRIGQSDHSTRSHFEPISSISTNTLVLPHTDPGYGYILNQNFSTSRIFVERYKRYIKISQLFLMIPVNIYQRCKSVVSFYSGNIQSMLLSSSGNWKGHTKLFTLRCPVPPQFHILLISKKWCLGQCEQSVFTIFLDVMPYYTLWWTSMLFFIGLNDSYSFYCVPC